MLEILAPAGNAECAHAAIDNGANAIYLGLDAFSARQGAENFTKESLQEILQKAHFCGVKVYVAMNTLVKEQELDGFILALGNAWNMGVDAVILQDIFLGRWIKERYPQIALHLSTQGGVCNLYGAKLAKEYGFSRVILARETPLQEVAEIANFMETEVFVQGALCTAYSGQCYFSSFVGGNSGNRGRCKQPCRKQYSYNRNGNSEKCYALSLSDLSVGEEIAKLVSAGVLSFKIEGRMRRSEYVAAAVRYYRQILEGKECAKALSDLKRTYNRGNYTRGLTFGQDKRLLSTAIQGHIGEKVGVVKVVNGKYLVESAFKPQVGDAFKILREGKEVAGAVFSKFEGRAFSINSKIRLKNGDGVFVTTDTAVNARVLSGEKKGQVHLELYFHEGEQAKVRVEGIEVMGGVLQSAQNRPLSIDELKNCFLKTDGLPVEVLFEKIDLTGDVFIPKSELNAFRREAYAALCRQMTEGKNPSCGYVPLAIPTLTGRNDKTAVITDDFTGIDVDIAIYKWKDLREKLPSSFVNGNFEKYLYYPAFLTNEDLLRLKELVHFVDGIYTENYGGITFAKEQGVKAFIGTGCNLVSPLVVNTLLREDCVAYYAMSKELNAEEMTSLVSDKVFALSSGDLKIMDLCYCPFGKTCTNCDKKECYELSDEGGRVFPVRRYLSAKGECRFEVYNCASLVGIGKKGAGQLLDLSLSNSAKGVTAKDDENAQKLVYGSYTSGHYKRGVL